MSRTRTTADHLGEANEALQQARLAADGRRLGMAELRVAAGRLVATTASLSDLASTMSGLITALPDRLVLEHDDPAADPHEAIAKAAAALTRYAGHLQAALADAGIAQEEIYPIGIDADLDA